MPTYLIGDVQGCYTELRRLLDRIAFDPANDQLGFVGDLVNRGPDSLAVLRFLNALKPAPQIVLGNHDLYLLVLGYGLIPTDTYSHTLDAVLNAPDRIELLDWLRQQPFVCLLQSYNAVLVHAGIPPQWSIADALAMSNTLTEVLQGKNFKTYLAHLFGNSPKQWRDHLTKQDRWRYITNAFTRMRFCQEEGNLEFNYQTKSDVTDTSFKPWFEWRKQDSPYNIFFGHWAMLQGNCNVQHCHALDTGCAWGESLTAIRLDDQKLFSVPAAT